MVPWRLRCIEVISSKVCAHAGIIGKLCGWPPAIQSIAENGGRYQHQPAENKPTTSILLLWQVAKPQILFCDIDSCTHSGDVRTLIFTAVEYPVCSLTYHNNLQQILLQKLILRSDTLCRTQYIFALLSCSLVLYPSSKQCIASNISIQLFCCAVTR